MISLRPSHVALTVQRSEMHPSVLRYRDREEQRKWQLWIGNQTLSIPALADELEDNHLRNLAKGQVQREEVMGWKPRREWERHYL